MTCSSTKRRVRTRTSSISGGNVKSMRAFPLVWRGHGAARLAPQRHHLSAIDHNRRARDIAAGLGGKQQQGAVKIMLLAEAADRNLALDGGPLLAGEIRAIHLGHEPARRNGVDPHPFERELERERLGELNDARF